MISLAVILVGVLLQSVVVYCLRHIAAAQEFGFLPWERATADRFEDLKPGGSLR